MDAFWIFVFGLAVGGTAGFVLAAMMHAAGDADDAHEHIRRPEL